MKQIKINLKEDDYRKLSDMAASQGITIAELIRRKFNFSLENTLTTKVHQRIDPDLLFELKKIADSLNKVAENMSNNIEVNSSILYEINRHVMRIV
ncbi:hypothetical protein [Sulfurimonas sp.]